VADLSGRLALTGLSTARAAHLPGMSTDIQGTPSPGLEPLLGIDAVAEYLGVSVTTIYDWRVAGKGPCAVRVGRHLKFALSDVVAWVTAHRETEPGRAPDVRR